MSKYAFSELVENVDELLFLCDGVHDDESCETLLICRAGYGLSAWESTAVFGWDDGLETYFLTAMDAGDDPVWWFGGTPREIKSPYILCAVLERLFYGSAANPSTFHFSESAIESLLQDRNKLILARYGEKEGLLFSEEDAAWRDNSQRANVLPDRYMKENLISGDWLDTHKPNIEKQTST